MDKKNWQKPLVKVFNVRIPDMLQGSNVEGFKRDKDDLSEENTGALWGN